MPIFGQCISCGHHAELKNDLCYLCRQQPSQPGYYSIRITDRRTGCHMFDTIYFDTNYDTWSRTLRGALAVQGYDDPHYAYQLIGPIYLTASGRQQQ